MGVSAGFCKDERMGAFSLLLLVKNGHAVGVPIEHLDSSPRLLTKTKRWPERGSWSGSRYQGGQAVEALTHIGVLGEVNANRALVRTWAFLHDSDETAERLGVESGRSGDRTSMGKVSSR